LGFGGDLLGEKDGAEGSALTGSYVKSVLGGLHHEYALKAAQR
jgi:hypothetical protein